jgi:hypothetical protein
LRRQDRLLVPKIPIKTSPAALFVDLLWIVFIVRYRAAIPPKLLISHHFLTKLAACHGQS